MQSDRAAFSAKEVFEILIRLLRLLVLRLPHAEQLRQARDIPVFHVSIDCCWMSQIAAVHLACSSGTAQHDSEQEHDCSPCSCMPTVHLIAREQLHRHHGNIFAPWLARRSIS